MMFIVWLLFLFQVGDAMQQPHRPSTHHGPRHYNFSTSSVFAGRGIAYQGSGARLRKVIHKLTVGEQVNVLALGGSISWGQAASQRNETDWFSLVIAWMKRAFPRATIVTRNAAVPASRTPFTIMCVQTISDNFDPDLVFTEFLTNDQGHVVTDRSDATLLDHEKLLRKLLAYPRQPAVVVYNTPPTGLFAHYQPKDISVPLRPLHFHESNEDWYSMVSQYYDVPVLSFRDVAWHLAWQQVAGFREQEVMFMDRKHPTDVGFKLMADSAVLLLQRVRMDLAMHPYGDEEAHLPLPADFLPPPLYKDNYAPITQVCAYQDGLQPYVTEHVDWQWVDEGQEGKPKKGYVTTKPGALLRITINSEQLANETQQAAPAPAQTEGGEGKPPEPVTLVFIAYLRSYKGMGTALIRCLSGCRCTEATVNALKPEEKFSQNQLAMLLVTRHPKCELGVTLQPGGEEGAKFKVAGLMVTFPRHTDHGTLYYTSGFDPFGPFGVLDQGYI